MAFLKWSVVAAAVLWMGIGLGCTRKLDEDLCADLVAKGKACQAPYFTAVMDEMCKALEGKAVADVEMLKRYRDMPCDQLSVEFGKDMAEAVKQGDKPKDR